MSNKPLVSAITIFLNEERFLEEAIESVFSQTYDCWELLLVDDGSTDRSTEIAQRYETNYPAKVRYLEHQGHQNRGMSASRNFGVCQAKGKYVSYLDGDDLWLPQKLERQVAILESQPEADMVCGPLYEWYSWTGNPQDFKRDGIYGTGKTGIHPYNNTLVEPPRLLTLFLRDKDFTPTGVLVQREILKSLARSEESFRRNYSDDVVQVKACLHSKVFVSNECLYKYRIHPDSCCRVEKRLGNSDLSRLIFLNWVEEYLSKQGAAYPEVWQALRQALRRARHAKLYRSIDFHNHLWRMENIIAEIGRKTLPASARRKIWALWDSFKTANR